MFVHMYIHTTYTNWVYISALSHIGFNGDMMVPISLGVQG